MLSEQDVLSAFLKFWNEFDAVNNYFKFADVNPLTSLSKALAGDNIEYITFWTFTGSVNITLRRGYAFIDASWTRAICKKYLMHVLYVCTLKVSNKVVFFQR